MNINRISPLKGGEEEMTQIREPSRMIRLRLELDTDGLDYERRKNLVKYGKVAEGLIRDVIMPDTMTLHSLHYLIQKCFGWQNSHLHHFAPLLSLLFIFFSPLICDTLRRIKSKRIAIKIRVERAYISGVTRFFVLYNVTWRFCY